MKKHPILDLYCNEDGTKVIFKERELHITVRYKDGKTVMRQVNFNCRTIPVVRIVCECYHGMRDSKDLFPQRADHDLTNDHYTNLSWGKRRKKPSVFTDDKKVELLKELDAGKKAPELSKKYGVREQTINKIKNKHFRNKQ